MSLAFRQIQRQANEPQKNTNNKLQKTIIAALRILETKLFKGSLKPTETKGAED